MTPRADDDRLLAVAASISYGTPIDWAGVSGQFDDPNDAAILEQLKLLHGVAAVHAEPQTWGSFTILDAIGLGSFGTVYRAFDADLHRDVALKIVGSDGVVPFDPQRAVGEARRLARVRHPNVVTVFGAQRKDNAIAVSMELIKGHTLDEIVAQHGRMTAAEATLIGIDLCRAVAAVHDAGLIHGDIKAHNVMREETGRVVLMDFGAGRELGAGLPTGGDMVGTPIYLAPEVFAGHPRTTASDIYSLGVLLYYLTTGTYPVDGHTRTEIDRRHQQPGMRRPIRDVRPDLPEPFIQVVERACADVASRYQTAGALEAALVSIQQQPQEIVRPRAAGRILAVAGSVVLATALVGTAAYVGYTRPGDATVNRSLSTATDPAAPPAVSPAVSSAVSSANAPGASPAAGTYRVDAGLYRPVDGTPSRLTANTQLTPGDPLFLQLRVSVPAHVYVVNEDDQGESTLLYPLSGQAREPVPAGQAVHLPGEQAGREVYWQVSTAGGREHFLIFVSPERLPAFEKIFATMPQASHDRPVMSQPLSMAAVGQLRSVGGLVYAPPAANRPRLSLQFNTPLSDVEETTSGLWVRQVTLRNP